MNLHTEIEQQLPGHLTVKITINLALFLGLENTDPDLF